VGRLCNGGGVGVTGGVKMQEKGDLKMQGFSWVPPVQVDAF